MKKALISILSFCTASSLCAAPQAVVFDFGGVLTGEQNRQIIIEFLQSTLHLSAQEFEEANQEKRQALKEGKTDEAFWLEFAREHQIRLAPDWKRSFKDVMKEGIGVNTSMYQLVEELEESGMQVALLSNIDTRLSHLIAGFGLYQPFDPCLLSCEIGCEKPDPRAYQILLSKLKLPAQDIVFIDDRLENIEAAKQLGIDALLFESENQLRQQLAARGIL